MIALAETVVLDSEGLSAWIREDRSFMARMHEFHRMGAEIVVCATTIIEVTHARVDIPRLNWLLSQVRVEPVTATSARAAARLLVDAGLHGHRHALDATVAEAAHRQPPPVVVVTSDDNDLRRLCPRQVHIMHV